MNAPRRKELNAIYALIEQARDRLQTVKDDEEEYLWAYLDGKKLVEVIQAALDNNMLVSDMKQLLIDENAGHTIEFKVVKQ